MYVAGAGFGWQDKYLMMVLCFRFVVTSDRPTSSSGNVPERGGLRPTSRTCVTATYPLRARRTGRGPFPVSWVCAFVVGAAWACHLWQDNCLSTEARSPTKQGCKCLATLVISPCGRWVIIHKLASISAFRSTGSRPQRLSFLLVRQVPCDRVNAPIGQVSIYSSNHYKLMVNCQRKCADSEQK